MSNAAALEEDIAVAMAEAGVTGTTATSLACHVQTVIQGAFILAKSQEPGAAAAMAREAIGHLRRYFELLFNPGAQGEPRCA